MDSNVTVNIDHCNNYFAENLSFNTALISVFLCFGIVGNSLVLFLYKYRMPQTEERFFIPHLAVADLLSTVSLACLSITANFYFTDFPNEGVCKFLPYFSWVTTSWSAFILLLISVSRYLKICRPTGKQMTRFRKKVAVLGCLLFAVCNTSPLLYFAGHKYLDVTCLNMNMTVVLCDLQDFDGTVNSIKNTYMFFEFFIIFINAGITAALYIPIGLQIFRRFKRKSSHNFSRPNNDESENAMNETEFSRTELTELSADDEEDMGAKAVSISESIAGDENQQPAGTRTQQETSNTVEANHRSAIGCTQMHRNTSREKRIKRHSKYERNIKVRNNFTYMFITIMIFYFVSYLPTFILIILAADDPFYYWYSKDVTTLNFLMTLRRSSVINHIVNPFIYGYFDQVFRKCFVDSLTCK